MMGGNGKRDTFGKAIRVKVIDAIVNQKNDSMMGCSSQEERGPSIKRRGAGGGEGWKTGDGGSGAQRASKKNPNRANIFARRKIRMEGKERYHPPK
jgi:hypothetical protein